MKKDTIKKGPCCVCKETKKIRNECIMFKSEEECQKEIKANLDCLAKYNFKPIKTDK